MLRKLVPVVFLSLAISGCGGFEHVKEMEGSNKSLVFGYIDVEGSHTVLDTVTFAQVYPGKKEELLGVRVSDGAFYLENVTNGSYRISNFVRRLGANSYMSVIPESGQGARSFKIDNPGLHFLGAYKYTRIQLGFSKYTFELKPATSPSQKQVLEKILPMTKDTKWENLIQKRLRELK